MALGIDLRLLRDRIERDPQDAIELLDASLQELSEATAELRELARGISAGRSRRQQLAMAGSCLLLRSVTYVSAKVVIRTHFAVAVSHS